jgi:hypothetical protein
MDDIHFEPFFVESGGKLGERAQEIFSDLVTGGTLDKLANLLIRIVEKLPKKLESLGLIEEQSLTSEQKVKEKSGIIENATKSKIDLSKIDLNRLQDLANRDKGLFGFTNELNPVSNTSVDEARSILELLKNENLAPEQFQKLLEGLEGTQSKLATGTLIKTGKLAAGGLVTQGGMAKVDTGEVYLGTNSLQIIKEMADALIAQNKYLEAMASKNYTPVIEMNGIKLSEAQDLIINKG